MDAAGDDPDPGGPRPSLFYGLWPRFVFAEDADEGNAAEFAASAGAKAEE